jgi:hypothetical protein
MPHGAPAGAPGAANDELERPRRQHAALLLALRELAAKATPGPWSAVNWTCHAPTTIKGGADGEMVVAETTGFGRYADECAVDAVFIAAANPEAVLSLLDYITALEGRLEATMPTPVWVGMDLAAGGEVVGEFRLVGEATCEHRIFETQLTRPDSVPASAPEAGDVGPRYKVVDCSQSAHCCFGCTVVDTTKPEMIGGKHYNDQYESVCETFDRADADLICAALNASRPAAANADGLLDMLANHGGTIVRTASLDSVQIAAARIEKRMFVREDDCGFVYVPPARPAAEKARLGCNPSPRSWVAEHFSAAAEEAAKRTQRPTFYARQLDVNKLPEGEGVLVSRQAHGEWVIPLYVGKAPAADAGAQILKGIGKINGDGWKDVTRKGEVVFVWNTELPGPYAPGQFPRIGNRCGWSASTAQYDFVPASAEESRDAIEAMLAERPLPADLHGDSAAAVGAVDPATREDEISRLQRKLDNTPIQRSSDRFDIAVEIDRLKTERDRAAAVGAAGQKGGA